MSSERPDTFKPVDFTGREYTFNLDYRSDSMRFAGQEFLGFFYLTGKPVAGLWIHSERELVSNGVFENVFRTLEAYRLEQDNQNQLHTISPASALAALIACAPFVNADPFRHDQLVENLAKLIGKVPVKKLHFSIEDGFWDLLG